MKGHLSPPADSVKITTRLTPQILYDMGVFNKFPDKSQTMTYRLFGNHQHTNFQNKNMGHFEIQKQVNDNHITFNIEKVVINNDAITQMVKASLQVKNDQLLTPISYSVTSTFSDNALCVRDDLTTIRTGLVKNNHIIETINNNSFKRPYSGLLIFDYTMYDISTRVKSLPTFTYYENLYALKNDQHYLKSEKLIYLNKLPYKRIVHYGRGMATRQFFIDDNKRVVMMIQEQLVYILDEFAKQETIQVQEDLIKGGVYYEY